MIFLSFTKNSNSAAAFASHGARWWLSRLVWNSAHSFFSLDVALRSLALCITGGEGEIVLEKALLCEVEDITSCLEQFGYSVARIGFEAGTVSQTKGAN